MNRSPVGGEALPDLLLPQQYVMWSRPRAHACQYPALSLAGEGFAETAGTGRCSAVAVDVGDGPVVGVGNAVGARVACVVAVGDGSVVGAGNPVGVRVAVGGTAVLAAVRDGVSDTRLAVAAASGGAGVTVASGDSQAPHAASSAASR